MFFPFFENLKNISEYNLAYYAAISSVERWELVLKYKKPWFQWTGGFQNGMKYWPNSDDNSDFWIVNDGQNGMRRNITSRTKSIPNTWWWNVDFMLASNDSSDYNSIGYFQREKFILDVDDTTNVNNYYNSTGIMKYFSGDYVSWVFRLPPKIYSWFSGSTLCDDANSSLCDIDWDWLYDEVVANRSLDWTYKNSANELNTFSITPRRSVIYNSIPAYVDFYSDNAIRESLFTDDQKALFSTKLNHFSPVESPYWFSETKHNIIGKDADTLKIESFDDLLQNDNITWLSLKFSLFDLLRTKNENIYPFLEYKFEFPTEVSDRFYNIQWVGKVWDYDIYINVAKPTSNDSSIWEFTIIF